MKKNSEATKREASYRNTDTTGTEVNVEGEHANRGAKPTMTSSKTAQTKRRHITADHGERAERQGGGRRRHNTIAHRRRRGPERPQGATQER